jgi:putative ATP-dependent endonuclease of OLD family
MSAAAKAANASPAIYRLTIERFRGIEKLVWLPSRGLNVILGGGDVGKTTILDAIALILSPTNPSVLSDTDYYGREDAAGFSIEAVLSLPPGCGIDHQQKPSWVWEWKDGEARVPSTEDDKKQDGEGVYIVRVSGTEDLELVYEVVQPDGSADPFPVALRRAIGLVRLGGDDRNDRDLRLVQGSALDRLLSDRNLRSRIANELAESDVKEQLTEDKKKALDELDKTFKERSLPSGLDLAITGGQGLSVTALIGLTAERLGVPLPLASWGAGTRRLAALAIAEQNQGESPITLVDEIERGLEPYRQRSLVEKLQTCASQVFMTTHSPAALSAASKAAIWHVDHKGCIGPLDGTKIARHRANDPETFLARIATVAEGATEAGFVSALFERATGQPLVQTGIHIADGGGHETTLDLLEALAKGGLSFAGFADDEGGLHSQRWADLGSKLGPLLFRWKKGCIEENIIAAISDDKLEALITDPEGEKTGMRLRTLADRLGIEAKDFASIEAKASEGLRDLIVSAVLGTVPEGKDEQKKEYRKHAQTWFKSRAGGRELFIKTFDLGAWPSLRDQLLPHCNAVRAALGLPPVTEMPP